MEIAALFISLMITYFLTQNIFSGLVDNHTQIPFTGGIGILITIMILQSVYPINPILLSYVTLAFFLGLIDDLIVMKWWGKLICQLCLGMGYVGVMGGFGWFEYGPVDQMISCLWIVGVMNAYNLSDNMDGLAGGLGLLMFMILWGLGNGFGGLMVFVMLGFLAFNVFGKIWLGDSGSMMLGFLLAHMCGGLGPVAGILMLGVPLIDTVYVSVSRLLRGKWPWQGGKDHLSHRLSNHMGLGDRKAVWLLWGLCAGFNVMAWRAL